MNDDFLEEFKNLQRKYNIKQFLLFYVTEEDERRYINFQQDSFEEFRETIKKNINVIIDEADREVN